MFNQVIVGFDPGTIKTGLCVGEGRLVVASGFWTLGKGGKAHLWTRLGELQRRVDLLLSVWRPEIVACELPHPTRNAHTARTLGISVGHIHNAACRIGAMWVPIHNASLRATGCYKGNLARAAERAGKLEVGEDEADAIGAWLYAMRKAAVIWEQQTLPALSLAGFEEDKWRGLRTSQGGGHENQLPSCRA